MQASSAKSVPAPPANGEIAPFLAMVGKHVLAHRHRTGMSRRVLSEKSGVSPRYLAQLESGRGNISIGLLKRISMALGCTMAELVSSPREAETKLRRRSSARVALIGLRGAGKSTLGRRAAQALAWPFVELNDRIEIAGGIPVNEVFSLYGEEGYRRLERQALMQATDEADEMVLAVAGGIVADPETFNFLLERYRVVWLRASAEDHMKRVRGQGDERPMTGNPDAMSDLRNILLNREVFYSRADATIQTSGRSESECLKTLLSIIREPENGEMPGNGAAGEN
ncbi:MAG: helix-turn-helix transcriptional regulator [Paracoccaceae bacterium]